MLRLRFEGTSLLCAVVIGVAAALETMCLCPTPASAQSMSRRAPPVLGGGDKRKSQPRRSVPYYGAQSNVELKEVLIEGNARVPDAKVRSYLKVRPNRTFDPELVRGDVRALMSSGLFHDVQTLTEDVPGGVRLTFKVFERPTIGYVHFVGNKGLKDKVLLRESGLKEGEALNVYSVDEGRRKLEQYYRTKGYGRVQVSVIEGDKPEHLGIAYKIHEGPLQRVLRTRFVGNQVLSGSVLKARARIESKPGILWLFKGKVDTQKIDEDVDRLTAYYRSLGFFQAKIGRELKFDDDQKWLTLTFVIDEGPRYKIRNISFLGNKKYPTEEISGGLEIKAGDYFNLATLRRDENTLRDTYGSRGHIRANINAEIRFPEEPGELDVVYQVAEGEQYRVGKIFVNIDGDYAHTRRSVVLNRLSLRPGDIVDIREVRASERRLTASQLFLNDPARGITPQIVVKPPELGDDAEMIADRPGSPSGPGTFRGQSPDGEEETRNRARPHVSYHRGPRAALADLHIHVTTSSQDSGSAP